MNRKDIVACQQSGVSDEPPWLQAAARHGSRDPLAGRNLNKPLKIKKDGPTIGPVLLRQGEAGMSQYIIRHHVHIGSHPAYFLTMFSMGKSLHTRFFY